MTAERNGINLVLVFRQSLEKPLNLIYFHILINTVKTQTKLLRCLFVFFFRKINSGLRGYSEF